MDISTVRATSRQLRMCVLLFIGALPCVASRADELRGPYLGASLHRATFHFDGAPDFSAPPDFPSVDFRGQDTALKLLGGHRLTDRFAVEGTYFTVRDTDADSSTGEFAVLSVVAAGIWPIGKVELYGKAGLSYWKSTIRRDQEPASRDSLVDPAVGVGIQYRLGKLTLRADFDVVVLHFVDALGSAPSDGGSVETFSVGTVWRFR